MANTYALTAGKQNELTAQFHAKLKDKHPNEVKNYVDNFMLIDIMETITGEGADTLKGAYKNFRGERSLSGIGALGMIMDSALLAYYGDPVTIIGRGGDAQFNSRPARLEKKTAFLVEKPNKAGGALFGIKASQLNVDAPKNFSMTAIRVNLDGTNTQTYVDVPTAVLKELYSESSQKGGNFILSLGVQKDGSLRNIGKVNSVLNPYVTLDHETHVKELMRSI